MIYGAELECAHRRAFDIVMLKQETGLTLIPVGHHRMTAI